MCLPASESNLTVRALGDSNQVVLAAPLNALQYRVTEVVSGTLPSTGLINEPVTQVDSVAARNGKPLLLIRGGNHAWVSLGSISPEHAPWLRQFVAIKRKKSASESEAQALVAFLLPSLESSESIVADIAYSEIAAASFAAMLSNRSKIDVGAVRQWLADPALASRQPLYLLLLGIAGGPQDLHWIERRLDAAWRANDAFNLSPLLAADLELRGSASVDWIEAKYLRDPRRTPSEVQAAVLALSEQGRINGRVPRQRVIQAYRVFIREHKSMAGLVAQDLADWNYWEAVPEYLALLESGGVSPTSRYAIVNYLQRSQRAEAPSALNSLSAYPR